MQRYTADTLIRDVLRSAPESAAIFEKHGLGCASCLAADMETIDAVAHMHDVSVEALLAELNRLPSEPAPEEQR
ncbi:MAG: DUF1858 domain-containing protein [Coriobacteriales bacterium]|nr:DUF1858 domain-containing protein [Coriobacteriales bacterium]